MITTERFQTERQATDKQMFGPVMPVESANKYQPMETPEVHPGKVLSTPHYRYLLYLIVELDSIFKWDNAVSE